MPEHDFPHSPDSAGKTVNAIVDTGCSNSIMSTATVAQMHLQQLMDEGEKLASCLQGLRVRHNGEGAPNLTQPICREETFRFLL